jgi:hypothetical protein
VWLICSGLSLGGFERGAIPLVEKAVHPTLSVYDAALACLQAAVERVENWSNFDQLRCVWYCTTNTILYCIVRCREVIMFLVYVL